MTWETIKPFLDQLLTDQHAFVNTKTSHILIRNNNLVFDKIK